jgi:hypothetical protein
VVPSISDSTGLSESLGEEPEFRGGVPDVRKIAVDTVSRHKATKAPAVDSASRLLDRLRLCVGHRPKRRIRLDDRGQPGMGDTLVLMRAASHHLLHVLEPRQAQPKHVALLRRLAAAADEDRAPTFNFILEHDPPKGDPLDRASVIYSSLTRDDLLMTFAFLRVHLFPMLRITSSDGSGAASGCCSRRASSYGRRPAATMARTL